MGSARVTLRTAGKVLLAVLFAAAWVAAYAVFA